MFLTDVTLPSPLPAWERLAAACIREPEARAHLLELSVSVPRRTPRAGRWPFIELGPRGRTELWGHRPGPPRRWTALWEEGQGRVRSGRQSFPKRQSRARPAATELP